MEHSTTKSQSTRVFFDSTATNEVLEEEEADPLPDLTNTSIWILYVIAMKNHHTYEKDKQIWFIAQRENSQ